MRTILAIALASLVVISVGPAQQPNPAPAKADPLEQLQAKALKNNPNIKVLEAKARLAEAMLEQERAHLKAKVAVQFAEVLAARAGVAEGKERYDRAERLFKQKPPAIAKEDLGAAKLTYEKLKAELAIHEAKLKALVGDKK